MPHCAERAAEAGKSQSHTGRPKAAHRGKGVIREKWLDDELILVPILPGDL